MIPNAREPLLSGSGSLFITLTSFCVEMKRKKQRINTRYAAFSDIKPPEHGSEHNSKEPVLQLC